MSGADGYPLRALARHAFADPVAPDLLAALRPEPDAPRRRLIAVSDGAWPDERRAFLPFMAHARVDAGLPADHPVRVILRASRLHEGLRFAAIDKVADLVRGRLTADGLPARFVGGYDLARFYPQPTMRHVHALRLWFPSAAALGAAMQSLQQGGLTLASAAGLNRAVRLRHENGCLVVLDTALLPSGFAGSVENLFRRRVEAEETATPETRFMRLVGIALGKPALPATQFILDAHFLLGGGVSPDRLAPLATAMGLALPAAALIEQTGYSPVALGFSAADDLSVPLSVIRHLTRAAWRRSGRHPLSLLAAGGGVAARLRIAQAVAGLATTHMARRLRLAGEH